MQHAKAADLVERHRAEAAALDRLFTDGEMSTCILSSVSDESAFCCSVLADQQPCSATSVNCC